MRVFGDFRDETKEFIFARDLGHARPGSSSIARAWAFNKIYHLIGEMSIEGEDLAKKQEIEHLSQKFSIQTPYELQ